MTTTVTVEWPTEWRVERFYPFYYSMRRPEPVGLPTTLGYGGPYFNITLSSTDLGTNPKAALDNTRVVIMKTGFSTHAINFGQKLVQLNSTYTLDDSGAATLHVSQMPPNVAILAPGPAWIYVVVDEVPSVGQPIMIGSGKIETQNVTTPAELPVTYVPSQFNTTTTTNNGGGNGGSNTGAASSLHSAGSLTFGMAVSLILGVAALW